VPAAGARSVGNSARTVVRASWRLSGNAFTSAFVDVVVAVLSRCLGLMLAASRAPISKANGCGGLGA